jgi:hypothetical protein
MGFFSSDLFGTLVGGILTTGTGLILNNQAKQTAKGQANSQKEALELQLAITKQQEQNLMLQNQINQPKPQDGKSNLPLYIGLGVGGVVILGLVIFAVSRK